MNQTQNKFFTIGFAIIVALCYLVAIRYRLAHELPDDAAFFLRYAENMVQGQFWVYNLGEAPVWGASAPLFPLLFVLPLKFGVAPIAAVQWTSTLVSVVALTWAALLMARHFGYVAAWALVIFLCLDSGLMDFAGSGLETPLTCLLLVAALHMLLAGRQGIWLGVVVGLLAIHKLDLIAMAALLLLAAAVAARRIPWQAVGAAAVIAVAWYGFAWYWFGLPVPNSFLTKALHQNDMHKLIGWDWFALSVLVRYKHWIFAVLALLGVQACWRAHKPLLVFCLGSLGAHLLAYSVKYPFEPYDWYYMPALLLLLWLAALGIKQAGTFVGAYAPQARWLSALSAALLCGLIVWHLVPLERQQTRERKQWLNLGEHDRAQAGRWINAHTPSWFKVETCWGNPAVFSRRYVYDCSFLNRPAEDHAQDLRERYRPEIVVYQNAQDVSPTHLPHIPGYVPVHLFDRAFDAGLGNYFFFAYARKDVLSQVSDVSLAAGCLAQGPDACDRYLPQPIQKLQATDSGETPAPGALCSLDSINGGAATQAPVSKAQPIELAGWAFMADRKSQPDSVWLMIEQAGRRYTARARGGFPRPEVARGIGAPASLTNSGFQLKFDASDLAPGAYDVSIILIRGDQKQMCHAANLNLR
ncbi:MAG: glycosyltransferase 87 family protein [Burkholderiaceae bacterium]|jgi:hypothetical protein|nr:glycosyltransferase 87 family protein [Burkholderiaceae bacterium]